MSRHTTNYEIELGVVIGRTSTRFEQAAAWDPLPDTASSSTSPNANANSTRGGTWDKGKAYDNFAPLGPWLVTADEVVDPHDLTMNLAIDRQTRQHANTPTPTTCTTASTTASTTSSPTSASS